MKPFEYEPTWLTFPGRAIMFPAVYTPHTQFGHTKFRITADAKLMRRDPAAEDFVAQFVNDKGFISASSVSRPEVECFDVPRLVTALQCLDARNVNRDRIFTESPIVSLGLAPYRYTLQPSGAEGYTLILRRLRISLPKDRT